jgi:hypothetical protein
MDKGDKECLLTLVFRYSISLSIIEEDNPHWSKENHHSMEHFGGPHYVLLLLRKGWRSLFSHSLTSSSRGVGDQWLTMGMDSLTPEPALAS